MSGTPINGPAIVVALGVEKCFGKLQVLKGIDLTIRKGEVVVIVGASGSGKTTFIRCINHLEKIEKGRIEVNGHLIGYVERGGQLVEDREPNIARQRREIGMVFQRFNLFPHLTALENIIEAPLSKSALWFIGKGDVPRGTLLPLIHGGHGFKFLASRSLRICGNAGIGTYLSLSQTRPLSLVSGSVTHCNRFSGFQHPRNR